MRELLFDSDDHFSSNEYAGQVFYEHIQGDDRWKLNVSEESLKHLANGPEDQEYQDAWEDVLRLARFTRDGHEYMISQGDYGSVYLNPLSECPLVMTGNHGIYAYQNIYVQFLRFIDQPVSITGLIVELNITRIDADALTVGPIHDHYAEAGANLLDKTTAKDLKDRKYYLHQNECGDVWLIPESFVPED